MATVRKMSVLIDRTEKSWPLPSPPIGISNTFGEQWRFGCNGSMRGWWLSKEHILLTQTWLSQRDGGQGEREGGPRGGRPPCRAPPIGLSWNTSTRLSGLALSHPAGAFTKSIHTSRGDSPSTAVQLSWGMEAAAIVGHKRWKDPPARIPQQPALPLKTAKDTHGRIPPLKSSLYGECERRDLGQKRATGEPHLR